MTALRSADTPQDTTAQRDGVPIVPREHLDFGLASQDIPRHWFGGDPFKTRFFDAMSTLFPEGERFFITCVRDFRGQVTDAAQLQAIQDFTRQEAQHGQVHKAFNQRLAAQGIKVDRILDNQRRFLFDTARTRLSRRQTLALTAASEHLTAIMAQCWFERRDLFMDADPRVRAMYVWHAVEEVEHKGVAYDVMQEVARVGYVGRVLALLQVSIHFPLFVFQIMGHMFKVDGFNRRQRARLWAKGLWWLYGPGGMMTDVVRPYLAWYKPGFHPWDSGMLPHYPVWADALKRTGDVIAASDALTPPTRR
ncbi:metal-dependent hydrolase [Aquabacterium sp.]|uniref:metal-dependent hydrolase n=1 Tax=Aquabacterium sp. TaxID=1872578 RepID=UPI003D6CC3CC